MIPTRRPSLDRNARWLVVSAWPPELAPLRAVLPPRRGLTLASVGVGLVEAAANTARLLAEQRPDRLVLVGTAGVYPGHRRAFPLGAAAVVDEMILLPAILPGEHSYLPDLVPSRVRADSALVKALLRATRLPAAAVACPLAITASTRAAKTAARRSGCALENLEAFAVARAAAAAKVPFAAILGVANQVGPEGHREWQRHARQAAAAACAALLALLASTEASHRLRRPLDPAARG